MTTNPQDDHRRVLVIVDQLKTIGALAVAGARDCGADIAYLPGLAMRKAVDLFPGRAKIAAGGRVHHCRYRQDNVSYV